MNVVITIPAYNEADTILQVVQEIKKVMSASRYSYKILVVDDGSKDATAALAKKAGAIVYSHPKNYGLAETFKTEIEQCLKLNADIIVHTDADGQYPAGDIPKLIKEVENGTDLVLGSRLLGKIEEMPWIKRIGNKVFSKIISGVARLRVYDSQTGFRAFTKEVASKIEITSNFTYTQEQIIRAVRAKFSVKEIPIYFAKRKHGNSRLIKNPFDYALRATISILRIYRDYEPLKFFWSVGGTFFIIGAAAGSWLLYLFLMYGSIGHVPLTILSAVLMLIGVQIMLFGFLADIMRR
ncbi:glycosyltransferase family 2 protein [Candidatus Woesearchaeota archaeon]|nr:glycosyltransferase family 2 protein [Candidatus Woesearchaeota archaeon]